MSYVTKCLAMFTACCLAVSLFGCRAKVAKDPLAGVGGYKLVYKQRNGKLDTLQIARVLRERINAKDAGDVVVRPLDGGGCEILLPGASDERVAEIKKVIASGNLLQFRIVALRGMDDKLIKACQDGQDHEGAAWAAYDPDKVDFDSDVAVRTMPEGKSKVLTLTDQEVDAGHVEYASEGRDESLRPSLNCTFNAEGARRMKKLTSTNLRRQLAIIFDGSVISAPTIQSPISTECQLTGNFTQDEVRSMIIPLRQAQMFAVLEPTPTSEIKVAAESEK